MMSRNVSTTHKPSPKPPIDPLPDSDPLSLVETKLGFVEKIRKLIKDTVTIVLNPKEGIISIKTEPNRIVRSQKETIRYADISNYLKDLQFSFFKTADENDFYSSYIYLLKAQKLVDFLHKRGTELVNDKEWAMTNLNEIVFLQANGLSCLVQPLYKKVYESFRMGLRGLNKPVSLMTKDKIFFDYFGPMFEKTKFRLRTLLSMSLSFSEGFEHAKAVIKAEKAFNTAAELLLATLIVCYHYLFKYVEKAKQERQATRDNHIFVKIEYFANLVAIHKKLITSLAAVSFSTLRKSVSLSDIQAYDAKLVRMTQVDQVSIIPGPSNITNKSDGQFVNDARSMVFVTDGVMKQPVKLADSTVDRIAEILTKYKDEPDLIVLNNEKVLEASSLGEATILTLSQLNYFNFSDVLVTPRLKNEITETSVLEKIALVVISLYILATEHRFIEHMKNSQNRFYKYLFDFMPDAKPSQSEGILSKAVEIAYLYLPDHFTFVAQIFNVFRKFELNRSKCIPENSEEDSVYRFLAPLRNGFKSELIIPVVKVSKELPGNVFEYKERVRGRSQGLAPSVKKKFSTSSHLTAEGFYQRGLANASRLPSTDAGKYNKTVVLPKSNNYLEKLKKPMDAKERDMLMSKTAEGFFKNKTKVLNENVIRPDLKQKSVDKSRVGVTKVGSSNPRLIDFSKNKSLQLSSAIQKHLIGKIGSRELKPESLPGDLTGLGKTTEGPVVLQHNNNKINTNPNNLNSRVKSGTEEPVKRGTPPFMQKIANEPPEAIAKPRTNIKTIFNNKSTLNQILHKFKNKLND